MTKHRYLHRLEQRKLTERLKQETVFGLVVGLFLFLYGVAGYTMLLGLPDSIYLAMAVAGCLMVLTAISIPWAFERPSAVFRYGMGKFGHLVFSLVLACSYCLLLLPLRLFVRKKSRDSFLRQWSSPLEGGHAEGRSYWQPKATITISETGASQGFLVNICLLVQHIIRYGNWLLIPLVLVLLGIGVILFFAQTSALAPFIYTLF